MIKNNTSWVDVVDLMEIDSSLLKKREVLSNSNTGIWCNFQNTLELLSGHKSNVVNEYTKGVEIYLTQEQIAGYKKEYETTKNVWSFLSTIFSNAITTGAFRKEVPISVKWITGEV